MAINQERVSLKYRRRDWYTYQVGDRKIRSRIEAPDWFDGRMDGVDLPLSRERMEGNSESRSLVFDAGFKIEKIAQDSMIQ